MATSAVPFIPFKFIAPGAVVVGFSDKRKFGRVAFIGPLTNLLWDLLFYYYSIIIIRSTPICQRCASFNGWIALFNLLPFGILDGQAKIIFVKYDFLISIIAPTIDIIDEFR